MSGVLGHRRYAGVNDLIMGTGGTPTIPLFIGQGSVFGGIQGDHVGVAFRRWG